MTTKTKSQSKNWRDTTLGEVVTFQRGFDLPETERTPGDYPLVSAQGQTGTHSEYKAKAPGVTIGRSGSLGTVAYIDKDFWPLNTTLWVKDFGEKELIEKYENNIISSSQVIEQLIELSRSIKVQDEVGMHMGLSEEELAFYDALASGKESLKNAERKRIVKQVVQAIRRDATVDWADNDVIKARIRANVRLILLGNGFSAEEVDRVMPDIIEQAQCLFMPYVSPGL